MSTQKKIAEKKNSPKENENDEFSDDYDNLSNLEEQVLRGRRGQSVDPNAPLEKKSNNPEVLKRLQDIEREIFKRAKEKGII